MKKNLPKVLQIELDDTRNRLTLDGWEIHSALEVLLPDRLGGGTWRKVHFSLQDDVWVLSEYPEFSAVGLFAREIEKDES